MVSPSVRIIIEHFPVYVWLVIALILLVSELSTPGLFFFIAFAGGSVAAAAAAWFEYGLAVQCIVLLCASALSFVLLKWKYAAVVRHGGSAKTNVDALAGQEAVVLEEISHLNKGRVRIRGEVWPAKIDEKQKCIKKGEVVRIVRIEGNSVIVTGHTSTGG